MAATQNVKVTFTAVDNATATWSNLGGTQYVTASAAPTDGSAVGIYLTNVTSTGATINAFAPFTGSVTLRIATP